MKRKPLRNIIAYGLIAILLGALGMLFTNTRQSSRSEVSRELVGNFDTETQAMIAGTDRIVFMIPFSHWDTDWHQDYAAYSKMADQNILKAIELAKGDSRYRFTLEQVLFVQHFWDTHPDSRADLSAMVRNRQITFAWAGITQPDTSLVAPSVQVHNLQLGQDWITHTFGADYVPHTAWQSDAFGNSAAFPTFLTESRVPYLFIGRHQGRCDPDYQECQPLPPAFYWTSPASPKGRVLVSYISYPSAWGDIYQHADPDAQLAALRRTINAEFKKTDSRIMLIPVGFDFFDPRPDLLALLDRWNASDQDIKLIMADPDSAFQYLAMEPLPEIKIDLNPIWQAFYNTRPYAKIADKESEYYLSAADKFALFLGGQKPDSWDKSAFNAHYDNISGVSYDVVWEKSQRPRYEQTLESARGDLAGILSRVSSRIEAPVVIFNPTSWSRSEVLEIRSESLDLDTLSEPVQLTGSDKVAFRVQNVPALGYLALTGGTSTIEHPVSLVQTKDQVTLTNGLVSVTLSGDHGGAFSSMLLDPDSAAPHELLSGYGDDVTYWDDNGDVYGAFFGQERARESEVAAQIEILTPGPLLARVQATFRLGGREVVKTVTMRADDPRIEVSLDLEALPETTAIAETSTILEASMRTDDLGFGAIAHTIDTRPIVPGDRTYRRSIFYPIMYWSDVTNDNLGLTLITHGLQGVSGGATRGVMLVRQVTQDPEGLTDPGVHHLRYAYLPHSGTVTEARPWLAAYEFNQPLIATWHDGKKIDVQLPFDETQPVRQFEQVAATHKFPLHSSLLSVQNVILTDLYLHDDMVQAVLVDYDPDDFAALRTNEGLVPLPQNVFTVMPLPPSSLILPP
jgi:hypothetical protein